MNFKSSFVVAKLLLAACLLGANAFVSVSVSVTPSTRGKFFLSIPRRSIIPSRFPLAASSSSDKEQEAKELLERVKKMRAEIAHLEGRSIEEVEQEAREKSEAKRMLELKAEAEREEASKMRSAKDRSTDGKFLSVPETFDDQISQAKGAVEKAFRDGITRQIVRFALLPEGEALNEDRLWPGGAQQMYREAAGPLTRSLLRDVRAPTGNATDLRTVYKPNVTSQDIWDFDGSAIITAEAATGPTDDVQALVFPNTDSKYLRDIKETDEAMRDRLFILVNPFWRNLDSWGFNILAPNAKKEAKEVIFDRGFQETYVLLQTSVRGEDCIALKVYPYDWQLYAYIEDDYWPYNEFATHLGSSKEEPTTAQFTELLNSREEFKLNKNMRQLQRMRGKD